MEDSDNHDRLFVHPKKDPEGEAVDQGSAGLTVEDGITKRLLPDTFEGGMHLIEKGLAKGRA